MQKQRPDFYAPPLLMTRMAFE